MWRPSGSPQGGLPASHTQLDPAGATGLTPAGSSPSHRVERVHYDAHDGPSFLQCTCGARLDSPTAEGIYKMWTKHRGPAKSHWLNGPGTFGFARYGGTI